MRNSSRLKLTHFFIAFNFMLLAGSLQQSWADANTSDTAAFQCGKVAHEVVKALGGTLTKAETKIKGYIGTLKQKKFPKIPDKVCTDGMKALSPNACCQKEVINMFGNIAQMVGGASDLSTSIAQACKYKQSPKQQLPIYLALGIMCRNQEGQSGAWCESLPPKSDEFQACACGAAMVSVLPLIRSGKAGSELKNAINNMDLQGTGLCKMIGNTNSSDCCTPKVKNAILKKFPGAAPQLDELCTLLGNSFEVGFLEAFAC